MPETFTKSGVTLDMSDFQQKFGHIAEEAIPDLLKKGLGVAGTQLLRDAVMQEPSVPLKEGTLRGSGSVHVEGNFVGSTREGVGGGPGTPLMSPVPKTAGPKAMEALVGFNTPYAAHLHEHPEYNFTDPGSGGKYLEIPMAQNHNLYIQVIAETVRLGGVGV